MALFVDALTLQLVLLVIASVMAAEFLWKSVKKRITGDYIKAFGLGYLALGVPSLVLSLFTAIIWPLPGSYNILFGDVATYLSFVLVAIGLVAYYVPKRLDALAWPVAISGAFSAFYGAVIFINSFTQAPLAAFGLFALEGFGAIFAAYGVKEKNATSMNIAIVLLLLGALMALIICVPSIMEHATMFASWAPK